MKRLLLILGLAVALAACGSTDKDRAVSGGGIGAGLGAATGLIIGGPFGGLVLGGAFGAAAGLVTDQDTVDLGDPLWKRDEAATESSGTSADRSDRTQAPDALSEGDVDQSGYDSGFVILQ